MSKVVATRRFLFSTAIGTVLVEKNLVEDPDIEDVLIDNAVTQARNLEFKNLGKQIDANANLPQASIPSAFLNPEQEDDEEEEIL